MLHNRRQWLGSSLGGLFALATVQQRNSLLAEKTKGVAKHCIVLWMGGGPSQLDTFDLKPGSRNGGEFKSVQTASPAIRISEHLPKLAKQMDRLSVIRNLSSKEGDHDRGAYTMHTGYSPIPSFPRPAAGAVVSKYAEESDIPKFVTLGSGNGFGPAFMGPDHAPFAIQDALQAKSLLDDLRRRRQRLSLLNRLGSTFDQKYEDVMLERRRGMLSKVERIVTTRFVEALDLEKEPKDIRERYGSSNFGQNCLLARRLIESGVRFVEVNLDGWDTHANNFQSIRDLSNQLDGPWASLMEDLSASGLIDETVVVWMGEFGRTPKINATNGRDHFPDVTPVVIGGGGIAGGRVVGKTTASGDEIDGDRYKVADLFATLYQRFGVAPDAEFTTDFDSPTQATEDGKVIAELI